MGSRCGVPSPPQARGSRGTFVSLVTVAALVVAACAEREPVDEAPAAAPAPPAVAGPPALPPFDEIGLYGPDSPWNRPIDAAATVDPDSDRYVAALVDEVATGDVVLAYGQYSSTVFFVDATTPRVDVPLLCGGPWELGVDTLLDVPVPPDARPADDADGADSPVPPGGCGDEADQDLHLVLVDPVARCEYDLWQARIENGRRVASWGNAISLDSTGIHEHGLSTRGSGFAFLGGVIWPDELVDGRIGHALAVSYALISAAGPAAPATESDGTSDDPAALPEGARLQLDPAVDIGSLGLDPVGYTIAAALQEYGAWIVDDSSRGLQFYAVDPDSTDGDPYGGLLPVDEDYLVLDGLPVDRLRVLELGPVDPDWRATVWPVDTPCVRFG